MKKIKLLLSAVLICGMLFTGCDEETKEVDTAKREKISSTAETSVKSVDESSENETKEEIINSENDDSDEEEQESNTEQNDAESTQPSMSSYSNESSNITDIAIALHEQGCEMQWNYLVGCPYNLDYDDMIDGAARVTDVGSLSEIIAEYCQVFDDNGEALSGKYFESDGKVYCYDGGRGVNVQYRATELVLVSEDENSALFTAVSHYADPETNEPMDNRAYDFKIVNAHGVWKISEFTLPY